MGDTELQQLPFAGRLRPRHHTRQLGPEVFSLHRYGLFWRILIAIEGGAVMTLYFVSGKANEDEFLDHETSGFSFTTSLLDIALICIVRVGTLSLLYCFIGKIDSLC